MWCDMDAWCARFGGRATHSCVRPGCQAAGSSRARQFRGLDKAVPPRSLKISRGYCRLRCSSAWQTARNPQIKGGTRDGVATSGRRLFRLILVKPSHYDDDGYVIQWLRSPIPANSLACLYGLARDARERQVLGPDIDLDIVAIDETNTRVRPDRIADAIRRGRCRLRHARRRAVEPVSRARSTSPCLCASGASSSASAAFTSPARSPCCRRSSRTCSGRSTSAAFVFAGEAEEGRLDRSCQDARRAARSRSTTS